MFEIDYDYYVVRDIQLSEKAKKFYELLCTKSIKVERVTNKEQYKNFKNFYIKFWGDDLKETFELYVDNSEKPLICAFNTKRRTLTNEFYQSFAIFKIFGEKAEAIISGEFDHECTLYDHINKILSEELSHNRAKKQKQINDSIDDLIAKMNQIL